MYLQLCYFNSSHALILVSKDGETEDCRLILIELLKSAAQSFQTSVSVPWKIDHLIKVPDTEEELFSIGLIRDYELDCHTFTLVSSHDATSVDIKAYRRLKYPICKYRYSVCLQNLYISKPTMLVCRLLIPVYKFFD